MEIIYEIRYNSKSEYIQTIIDALIKAEKLDAKCKQCTGYIYIIVNDSAEKIESFFKLLETKLPLSIYMESSKVIEKLPEGITFLEPHNVKPVLCLDNESVIELIKNNDHSQSQNAQAIASGEIVQLKSSNGLKYFAKPTQENREKLEAISKNVNMFIANTDAFETMFTLNQKDVQLLCSIERPLVKLKLNFQANSSKQYSSTDYIYAKMPYDKESFLLAYEIKALGYDALIYCSSENINEEIKVNYMEQKTFIIEGNSGLFPKYDYNAQQVFNSSKEYFNFYEGVYKATISEYNKRITPTIGIYFTTQNSNSEIAVNTPSTGKKTIISVPNIHLHLETNLEEIAELDENTPRLIENYKKKFPQLFENCDLTFEESSGFESIINLCAYMLGMSGSKAFEAAANNYSAKSGINIDMKVIKLDGVNYLDYRRSVQSIMSYKLADVPNDLLAFSFYESLSEFISNHVTTLKDELNITDVILCGNMFGNITLLEKTYKALNKTFNVLIPQEYPLDINC